MFTLFGGLSREEFRLLGKAVHSPLMNTNRRVIALYEYLSPFHPVFEGVELKSGVLFSRLFPEEPFDDYKLRRLLSAFSQAVEQFLIYLEASEAEPHASLLLIRALGRRNLHGLFEKRSMEALSGLEEAPYRDLEYYRRKVEVFANYYFHPLTDKRSVGQERLQELVHDMDYRYALEMYRLGNELRNRERMLSEQYQLAGIDAMASTHGDGVLSENNIFRTYRSLLRAYRNEEDPSLFRELKENFAAYADEMREDDKNLLFQQLLNYTIRRINQGDSAYYPEALQLYKMGLRSGWLIHGGRISEETFSNVVMVSCEKGEYGWARNFIARYETYLGEEAREDTIAHCYSLWNYFQGQHEKALELLAGHRFSGPFQPRSRMTAIRIIFEQFFTDRSYYDLLLSHARAFEKYLGRDKSLSRSRKDLHKNTTSLIRRVATALAKREPVEEVRQWALAEIHSGQPLVLRNWLQEKITGMKALPPG